MTSKPTRWTELGTKLAETEALAMLAAKVRECAKPGAPRARFVWDKNRNRFNIEKVLVGPVVPGFHGPVARIIELPNGGLRIEVWKRGTGWVDANGSIPLDEIFPGACRPASAKDAARFDIPAGELDNVTVEEIELAKHEMNAPRTIRGFLYGTVVSVLPLRGPRAKIIGLVKERAWHLAAANCRPGHA
jgi:hypothetical protein